MASITLSEYGKFVSLQNNSGSADAAAPEGGVYLFASGAIGSARLYLQNEGGTVTDVAKAVDIDAFDALGGTGLHQTQDHFLFSDNGTEKKITFSNLEDAIFGNVSGDIAVAAGGAATIQADAVESGMLNDNVISGQTELASDGLAAADELMISDGGTLKKIGVDNLMKDGPGLLSAAAVAVADDHFMFLDGGATGDAKVESVADLMTAVAGDGLAASSGVLAVGVDDSSIELNSDALRVKASGVTNAMLAGSIADSKLNTITTANKVSLAALDIDGATALGGASVAQADLLVIDDGAGGTNKSVTFSNFEDSIFGNVSGDIAVAAGGAATIQAGAVENSMLAGSIANAKLVNDSVTIGSTECDLGSTTTVFAGITQLTASAIRVTDLDVVTINSIAQTETTLEVSDKLIVAALSASSANSDGGGLKIGGGQNSAGNASVLYDHSNTALDFNIGGTTEVRLQDGVFRPETDNDVDLGASGAEFKDLYLDGVAYIDDLRPDLLKMPDNTSGKILVADGTSFEEVAMSGDVAIASNGATTIQADAVESGMLNDNVISGQTELASDGLAAADEMMISDGGTLKKIGVDNLMKDGPGLLSAAAVAVADDHFMFLDGGATGDAKIESVADLMTAVAGDGLAASSGVLAVGVDDSSIELNSDALRVKASGVTNAMLAGSIANAKLANSSVTVGGSAVSLGGTVTGAMIGAALNSDLGGNVQFGTQSDDTVAFGGPIKIGGNAIANSEGEATITLDADQNVAIAAALTVGGGYGSTGVTISSAGAIQSNSSLTVDEGATFGGGAGSTGLTITNAGNLTMDGNFQAGTDGSGSTFKVFGAAANEFISYDADNYFKLNGADGNAIVTMGGDAASDFGILLGNGSDNKHKVKASAFVTYSDESLKEDVSTMNTALDTVMSLNGVEFTWKDSGERDFGFIAQEVKSVLPKAVHNGSDGIHGVDYSRLTSVLVEAVKAQQVQIEELKALLKK